MTGSIRNHSPICATNVERSVTVKLTPVEHDILVGIAKANGRTKAAIVRELIKERICRASEA